MSAHTPGPWQVDRQDATGRYTVAKGLTVVATVSLEVDAHVIAAAPVLLEALEALVYEHSRIVEDSSDSGMRPDEDCEKARAAIRAAKGEEEEETA